MNKKYIWKWLFIGIGIMLIPFILDNLYSTRIYDSHLTSSEWASFNGSYIGAIVGGIITLVGVWATIKFTREQANEDRRLSIAPYLKYRIYDELERAREQYDLYLEYTEKGCNYYYNIRAVMELKNVGLGPCIQIKIYDVAFKSVADHKINCEYDVIEKDGGCSILITLGMGYDETETEKSIQEQYEDVLGQGLLTFTVRYKDLIENEYIQHIKMYAQKSWIAVSKPQKGHIPAGAIWQINEVTPVKIINKYK